MREEIKKASSGPLSIIVGAAGHRDLRPEDEQILQEKVDGLFKDWQGKYPHTRICLLSSLRPGAEHLVAKVALANGISLIVPLPLEREEFEKDLETERSKKDFREILSDPRVKSFVLPPGKDEAEKGTWETGSGYRENQQAQAAAYIVRHSQVLIALWDGREDGHTAKVIQWQLQGIPKDRAISFSLLDPVETGLVYQIVTPKRGNALPSIPFAVKGFPERGSSGSQRESENFIAEYEFIFKQIDTFNQDCLNSPPRLREQMERSREHLFPKEANGELGASLRSIREWFALADTLSSYYQQMKLATLKKLFGIVFLAVLFFEAYAHLRPDLDLLLWPYPLLLLAAALLKFQATRGGWEDKHQDYRALAEGLRVLFFWRLAGIQDSPADHYPHTQRTELDWIRVAIKNLSAETREVRSSHDASTPMDDIQLVRKYYMEKGQYAYFTQKAPENRKKELRYDRRILTFIVLSPLIALGLAARNLWGSPPLTFLHGAILAIAVALVLAALFEGYAQKKAFGELHKRYAWMKSLFGKALENLDILIREGDLAKSQELLKELGKEALVENGNWVLLHRERPLEVPKA